ncbi:MAG: type II toxin-antitoxin system VapC family toxin [Candidatus Nezhaarchaeota archaeon]|nr:type II toxin-antitoxin system VapC family toxin [Candidatus Nezhaarchaeota archaeon]
MRVIDSSTLIKYFAREDGWEKARKIILEGVITLDLAIKEVANALLKKVLRGDLSCEAAMGILKDMVEEKPIPIVNQDKYLVNAFEISAKHGLTIYDALFIALSKDRSQELVTSDAKQAKTAGKLGLKAILV